MGILVLALSAADRRDAKCLLLSGYDYLRRLIKKKRGAAKKTEAISGGGGNGLCVPLARRGREGEKKQSEKETKGRRFPGFHVAYDIKTALAL